MSELGRHDPDGVHKGMDWAVPRLAVRTLLVVWQLLSVCSAGLAEAQGRAGCASPQPPSIGIAFGRSSPYLELARGVIDVSGPGSVAVQGGAQFAGRAGVRASPVSVSVDRNPPRPRSEYGTWSVFVASG